VFIIIKSRCQIAFITDLFPAIENSDFNTSSSSEQGNLTVTFKNIALFIAQAQE
jgi:hypothetical protein